MKIGILTGGGDAPGLNGIIESCGRALIHSGHEVVGIRDGFQGIFENDVMPLNLETLDGLHALAGTILGTSNKCGTADREKEFLECYAKLGLDGMVVAGGDGTYRGLQQFQDKIPIVGVPKTIDNDLPGTEICFGYDTACSSVVDAVDALRFTARAHERIMVVEVMGRTAGWIALGGGLASVADAILIPEKPFDKNALAEFTRKRKAQGFRSMMIVISEGAHPEGEDPTVAFNVEGSPQSERLGGISMALSRWLETQVDWEARHVILGHLQRSKAPTTTDRFLTLSMGIHVARLVEAGKWGKAAVYREGKVVIAPITDLIGEARLIPAEHRWLQLAGDLGIFV